eukprot:14980761-Alexandrium_andersonii.AAC.1
MMRAAVLRVARNIEFGQQPAYLSGRGIFNVRIDDVEGFKNDVVAWAQHWRPDDSAIRLMQFQPFSASCSTGRPGGVRSGMRRRR